MKKYFLITLVFICASCCCSAQISIYLRLIDYSNRVLTTSGTPDANITPISNSIEPNSPQLIKVSAYSADVEQSLNIGSTATGAGAGRIVFNPMSITKTMDATSPVLFQNAASATPYKTAEVFFVNAQNVILMKQTYKLAAVKTVAWSAACAKDCAVVNEIVTFEYGGQIITINKSGEGKSGPSQAGWNKVRNTVDNDPTTVIIQ